MITFLVLLVMVIATAQGFERVGVRAVGAAWIAYLLAYAIHALPWQHAAVAGLAWQGVVAAAFGLAVWLARRAEA
jgi:hypothetical protein